MPKYEAVAATKAAAQKPKRGYSKHGLVRLRTAVRELGPRVVDRRTTLGKQLATWKADLVRDLGGDVSTQQAAIVDLAVRTRLLLDSIDAWLLTQPSLVNARKRALLPAVRERQYLADALARYMAQLGLERRPKDVDDLHSYIAGKARDGAPAEPEASRECYRSCLLSLGRMQRVESTPSAGHVSVPAATRIESRVRGVATERRQRR